MILVNSLGCSFSFAHKVRLPTPQLLKRGWEHSGEDGGRGTEGPCTHSWETAKQFLDEQNQHQLSAARCREPGDRRRVIARVLPNSQVVGLRRGEKKAKMFQKRRLGR